MQAFGGRDSFSCRPYACADSVCLKFLQMLHRHNQQRPCVRTTCRSPPQNTASPRTHAADPRMFALFQWCTYKLFRALPLVRLTFLV